MSLLNQLPEFDPCDPKQLREELKKTLDDFKEEVEDTFNHLSARSLGSFVVTMAALVAQMAQGAMVNFLAFVGSTLVGNLIGGITTMIGLAVSLVTGAEIMIKWLAASRLEETLSSRISLSESLEKDMTEVIEVLQALQDIDSDTGEILLHDIDRAYPHVQNAYRRVEMEKDKLDDIGNLQLSQKPIDSNSIGIARDNIDEAMQYLIGDQTINPAFRAQVKKINQKYRLGASAKLGDELIGASVASPLAVLEYFKQVSSDIANNHTEDGTVTDKGRRMLRNFLIDFVQAPGINQFFRNYASMRFLGSHMKSLGKHLPITAVVVSDFAKQGLTSAIDKSGLGETLDPLSTFKEEARGALDDAFEYLNLSTDNTAVEYESEEVNLGGESIQVRIAQSSVLMLDQWLDIVNYEVGGLKIFLNPAAENLKSVRNDMKDVKDNKESYNTNARKRQLLKDKMEWMSKLGVAKTLLASSEENKVQFANGAKATPENINDQFRDSLELYRSLQTTILNRTVEETAGGEVEELPQASDEILEKADKYLKSFVLGEVAVFDESRRRTLLAKLQSMKLSLKQMRRRDIEERSEARNFIRSVERNPLFSSTIKPSWEAMMEGLKDSQIGAFVYQDLANGNLGSLVNNLTNVGYGALQILNCSDATDDFANDSLLQIVSGGHKDRIEKARQLAEEVEEKMAELRNKKIILDNILKEAQESIRNSTSTL